MPLSYLARALTDMSLSTDKTDDLVLFCAGTSWDRGWYPEKHIASRLSQSFRILYVDPPVSALKAQGTQPGA